MCDKCKLSDQRIEFFKKTINGETDGLKIAAVQDLIKREEQQKADLHRAAAQ